MIYRDTVTRKELIDGIELLRAATMEESEESALLERLERGVSDPALSDYIVWSDMTATEIVCIVEAHQPIALS